MKKYLFSLLMLLSGFVFGQWDYDSDATGNWSTNGTWVGTRPGTTVQGEIIRINSGHTVTITSGGGVSLKENGGIQSELHVYGTLVVEGTLNLDNSIIHVHSGGSLTISPDRDNGANEVIFNNSSSIINEGTLVLDLGDVANLGGSSINNSGTLSVQDDLNNAGNITNSATGTFTVTGDVTNSGDLNNSGTFTAATIDNSGSISNVGTLDAVVSGGGTYSGDAPLPVELVSFNVVSSDKGVFVSWQTATEINNDYFTIERSSNGIDFEPIAKVSGAGNSSIVLDYKYLDNNPLAGVSYYRLRQTDYDGAFEEFNIASVSVSNVADVNVTVNNSGVQFDLGEEYENISVTVYNIIGNVEFTEYVDKASVVTISESQISEGVLIFKVVNPSGLNITRKINF